MRFSTPLAVFPTFSGFLLKYAGAQSHPYTPASSISAQQWSHLNESIGGSLHQGIPYSAACFSIVNGQNVEPDAGLCNVVQANFTNPFYRVEQYGAWMQTPWETCIKQVANKCVLDNSNASDPVPFTPPMACNQGSVPIFYIDIQEAGDVQAAFTFSSMTGVPLSIKNSGHEYKGRSSGIDTLGLWTHHLQEISYAEDFVPAGCSHSSVPAITVGAGVVWDTAYTFAEEQGVTIIGGYHETIGASGGWAMGGGHSVLSPAYGLGVDRVRQFEIVTPDGHIRIANSCQNSDLFWALRGGGGGTFGVVLKSVHEVIPRIVPLQGLILNYTQTSSNMEAFYQMVINNTVLWNEQQWGGHVKLNTMIYVTPSLTLEEARVSMQPAVDFALANGGHANITTFSSWFSFYNDQIKLQEAAVGTTFTLATRLIPATLFATEDGQATILSIVKKILSAGAMPYIPVVTPPFQNPLENVTSVTPAWYSALWHLGFHASWQWNSTVDEITDVFALLHNVTDFMTDLTPGSGAYLNEGDVFQKDHEEAFWGPNYPRLLEIKAKYDPEDLLDCHQCVGFETNSPRYRCYPDIQSNQ